MFLQLLVLLSAAWLAQAQCPPAKFDAADNFEVLKYLQGNSSSRAWYIQEQMVNSYQPANELFCVRAVYVPSNPRDLSAGIRVINTARRGSVTGRAVGSGTNGAPAITAFPDTTLPTSARRASKLRVGPSFLAWLWPTAYGPYWVVAAGKSADNTNYDWAIVTGGPPRTTTTGGCVVGPLNPGPLDVNNAGFWLFSRRPVDPANTAIMRKEAALRGLDLSVLRPVQQQGCIYPALPTAAATTATAGTAGEAAPEAASATFSESNIPQAAALEMALTAPDAAQPVAAAVAAPMDAAAATQTVAIAAAISNAVENNDLKGP